MNAFGNWFRVNTWQLLGNAKCSVFFRAKLQIDMHPFEGTTRYARTTSKENIQHIYTRPVGGCGTRSVNVASDAGKGMDYTSQLSQSRKFAPSSTVQVVRLVIIAMSSQLPLTV